MKPRLFFLTMSLLAVLLASSCAPTETPPPVPLTVESIPTAAAAEPSPAAESTAVLPTPGADLQIVPTSRGPDLHATDPTIVSLASGGLQLVEFFRFT